LLKLCTSIPPEYSILPAEIREQALFELENTKTSLLNALNTFPLVTRTQRTAQRKQEIEEELEKVDRGLEVYGQDRVIVRDGWDMQSDYVDLERHAMLGVTVHD